jgi:RNA polymerase sigma-70 factor, ECF subfamily
MDNQDKKIVSDYLAGREDNFQKLVSKYLRPIYNFLYQFTKDKTQADDLTQETFIKAWKNLKRFDQSKSLAPYGTGGSHSGFKTWLFTIAKNTAFDYFKKKKTISFSNFVDEEGNNKLENISDDNILPDEILNRKNIAEELEGKLQELPEHYRLILTLHYKEDFSLSEIAEILKIPYNTVKSQHQRGLLKLRRLLE